MKCVLHAKASFWSVRALKIQSRRSYLLPLLTSTPSAIHNLLPATSGLVLLSRRPAASSQPARGGGVCLFSECRRPLEKHALPPRPVLRASPTRLPLPTKSTSASTAVIISGTCQGVRRRADDQNASGALESGHFLVFLCVVCKRVSLRMGGKPISFATPPRKHFAQEKGGRTEMRTSLGP